MYRFFTILILSGCSNREIVLESKEHDNEQTIIVNVDEALNCPESSVLVDGEFCDGVIHECKKFIPGPVSDRCAVYGDNHKCVGNRTHLRFCIDMYEYPNLVGVKPATMMSWIDSKNACELEGKRLCTNKEWTLACEGPERSPYPYGYVRGKECNVDVELPVVNFNDFLSPRKVSAEVDRLDRRVHSGSMSLCVSAFGVFDMTGNVDEWVLNENHNKKTPISGLKGGYWGPVRNRCRPTTTAHNEWHYAYQSGTRCCSSPKDELVSN